MDGDGNKTESMKSAVASKKNKKEDGGVKDTRRTRMKALKKSQREARKELRQGQRRARKEQRGQEREERKDIRAEKRAIRKAKRTAKKVIKKFEKNLKKGPAKVMGGGGTRKHQMGGFLEMPTFDLDRDSI
jgi:vacuolar-type H+-ATPase subunit H